MAHDYDWIVVGSGFGGSVAALRLAEKGYTVAVLECGRRYEDEDFASRSTQLRRLVWMPKLGMKGILRITGFKDLFVMTGSGVGGGSLVYANTLYRPPDFVYDDPQWRDLEDWRTALEPHFREAERMLGVTVDRHEAPQDRLLRELADEWGVSETYERPAVGVFLGPPGEEVPDPYFGGEGPPRSGCIHCGNCTTGCRHNAKNTLVKNYLYLAERRGVSVLPERTVTDIWPIGGADGADGYAVTSERSGRWVRRDHRTLSAGGVVVAAGMLGTNALLQRCRVSRSLPRLSPRLGELVRTNSESMVTVTAPNESRAYPDAITITSTIDVDGDTHVEMCTPGRNADMLALMFAPLIRRGDRISRPLLFALGLLRHPLRFARSFDLRGWSRRSFYLLVMQSRDSAARLKPRSRLPTGHVVLGTEQDDERPIPDHIPAAYDAGERLADKVGGIAQAPLNEAALAIPFTGHVFGGATIGADPGSGVVDSRQRAFGYRNLLVCDGSTLPANLGVNPSLTIAALAEHSMSHVPPAPRVAGDGRVDARRGEAEPAVLAG